MFIELIDILRCPVKHEESWLVAAFGKMDGRFVIEGKLGCPVCFASYPIAGGIAEFTEPSASGDSANLTASADDVTRIAAMLDLTRPGKTVVLEGGYAALAASIVEMTGARVIALNAWPPIAESENVASVTAGERLPFANESVDGVVLGDSPRMEEAARVLKPAGRAVVPSSLKSVSGSYRELARDERNLVLESVGELVRLRRET